MKARTFLFTADLCSRAARTPITYMDTVPLERDFGFRPDTPLREGLRRFARWYKEYYKI